MKISQTAKSILVFLNNINDLITISNNRTLALEVLRALIVFAKNNQFELPMNHIQNFQRVCLDSKANILSSILSEIANDVIDVDKSMISN